MQEELAIYFPFLLYQLNKIKGLWHWTTSFKIVMLRHSFHTCVCSSIRVEISRQLSEVNSLVLPRGFQGLYSGLYSGLVVSIFTYWGNLLFKFNFINWVCESQRGCMWAWVQGEPEHAHAVASRQLRALRISFFTYFSFYKS